MAMRQYPPYPACKPSGIDWLGEIPEHWEIARIKHIAWFNYGESLSVDAREEGKIPVFGSNGQVGVHSLSNTHGSCLIIGRKGSFGKVNYSPSSCFAIDTTYFIDGTTTDCDIRWLYYCLGSIGLDNFSQDIGVPGLSREFAHNLWVPKISCFEQQAIAAFLDRETARIDALVSRYRRLAELLAEKRAALISRAVTRGLNEGVKMKDSGVDWLGEIPEGWGEAKIKLGFNIRLGKMLQPQPGSNEDTLEPYLRSANVLWEGVDTNDIQSMWFSSYEKRQYEIFPGDLIVCEGGDVGRAAIWEGQISPCYIQNAVHRISPKPGYENKFLYYWLYTLKIIGYIDLICSKATISHLTSVKLANLPLVIPPLPEQQAIAAFLDRETAKLDETKRKIEEMIGKLQEYRAALISAAVTGKIDVRTLSQPLPATESDGVRSDSACQGGEMSPEEGGAGWNIGGIR